MMPENVLQSMVTVDFDQSRVNTPEPETVSAHKPSDIHGYGGCDEHSGDSGIYNNDGGGGDIDHGGHGDESDLGSSQAISPTRSRTLGRWGLAEDARHRHRSTQRCCRTARTRGSLHPPSLWMYVVAALVPTRCDRLKREGG